MKSFVRRGLSLLLALLMAVDASVAGGLRSVSQLSPRPAINSANYARLQSEALSSGALWYPIRKMLTRTPLSAVRGGSFRSISDGQKVPTSRVLWAVGASALALTAALVVFHPGWMRLLEIVAAGVVVGINLLDSATGLSEPKNKQSQVIQVLGIDVEVREGGVASIDITRHPAPTKLTAMEDFLTSTGLRPEQGYYFGNENASATSRDGIVTRVLGRQVMACDADQEKVVWPATRIGVGPEAVLKELKRMLASNEKIEFLAFDVDDTLLGILPTGVGGPNRPADSKERLLEHRRELAEALAEFHRRGTRLVFMTDNDSREAQQRIGDPLVSLMTGTESAPTVAGSSPLYFYADGMVTKFTLPISPAPAPVYAAAYSLPYQLPRAVVRVISQVLGQVREGDTGTLHLSGLVGAYYEAVTLEHEGRREVRPDVQAAYPGFQDLRTQTPAGNPRFPSVKPRGMSSDGSAAQISVKGLASSFSPGAQVAEGSADHRRMLFRAILKALGERSDQKDDILLGEALPGGGEITPQTLLHIRRLMGVRDLISAQRMPYEHEASGQRALAAIRTICRKLQEEGKLLEEVTQEEFNQRFGSHPVMMAAGQGSRFSAFIHKAMARAGLDKSNLGLALEGSYCSPGAKPTIMVSDRIIGLLVKNQYLQDYHDDPQNREKMHTFDVDPSILACPPGKRARIIDPAVLDEDKVAHYIGRPMSEVDIVYLKSYAHGDNLMRAVEVLPENESPAYVQVAFAEMAPAILPTLTNASFVVYLEALGRDADALAGGKRSYLDIKNKGHFFFNNSSDQLIAYSDWEQIPHQRSTGRYDFVHAQTALQMQELEAKLLQLPNDTQERMTEIRKLRAIYPYLVISDDGFLFSQEKLLEIREKVKQWGSLSRATQDHIRSHFAILESPDRKTADILISANAGIFRTDVVRKLIPSTEKYFENGGFASHESALSASRDERESAHPRRIDSFWGVDAKNGDTKTLAWNLVRLIARQSLEKGKAPRVGFVSVGKAPDSLKDVERQLEFAATAAPDRPSPNRVIPEDLPGLMRARENLIRRDASALQEALVGMLADPQMLNHFQSVVRALGLLSVGKGDCQGVLLAVLKAIREQAAELVEKCHIPLAASVVAGLCQQAESGLIDLGLVNPEGSEEGASLLVRLREWQARWGGKTKDYLLQMLETLQPSLSAEVDRRRRDFLEISGGNEVLRKEMLDRHMSRYHVSLDHLVLENYIPEPDRKDRKAPYEEPEAFLMTGGNSGNFFTGVLPELTTPPPLREVRLNTVVGLQPFDDGGSSRDLMEQFEPYLGYIPPPGDEVNVMAGITSDRKRWVLRYRMKTDKGSLRDAMVRILALAARNVDDTGDRISENPALDEDWLVFCHHMLRTAEYLDEKYIHNGRVSILGNSIGNFFNVGMKLLEGAYSETTKKIDPVKYSEAIHKMVSILGVPDIHIEQSSLSRGTLYAILEAPAIQIGKEVLVLDETTLKRERVTCGGVEVLVGKNSHDNITVTIGGHEAEIQEHFVAGNIIRRAPKDHPEQGSHTEVWIRDGDDRLLSKVVLDPNGAGQPVTLGGVSLSVRGRLIIEQTQITDNVHDSPVRDMGLVDGAKAEANPQYVKLLKDTNDIVIMGPGSLVTSLAPEFLSKEIVGAMIERKRANKPTVFVFNPLRDNESVDYALDDFDALIFRVSGHHLEEMFNHIVINDLVDIARTAVEGSDGLDSKGEVRKLLGMLNEMEKHPRPEGPRDPKSASKFAKYSRGAMGATPQELRDLIDLVELGGVDKDYQFADVRRFKEKMERRGVQVHLSPLLSVVQKEVRDPGNVHWEEGPGYDRAALGEIVDDILFDGSKRSPEYKELQPKFGGDDYIMRTETRRMMGYFPHKPRRDILRDMREWWGSSHQWPARTPVITAAEVAKLPFPQLVIVNMAYTLVWMDKKHQSKSMDPKVLRGLKYYLQRGGVVLVISGFDQEQMFNTFVKKLPVQLRARVITAPSSGALAWGYPQGRKEVIYDQQIAEREITLWYGIVSKVCREFKLDRVLRSVSTGAVVDEKVPVVRREAQAVIEASARANLPSNVVQQINKELQAAGLEKYQIEKTPTGFLDIRPTIIRRLNDLFKQHNIAHVKASQAGLGAINTAVATPADVFERLNRAGVFKDRLIGGDLERNRVMLLGFGRKQFGPALEGATSVVFNLLNDPENIDGADYKLFAGSPGPGGFAEYMEALLGIPPLNQVSEAPERNEHGINGGGSPAASSPAPLLAMTAALGVVWALAIFVFGLDVSSRLWTVLGLGTAGFGGWTLTEMIAIGVQKLLCEAPADPEQALRDTVKQVFADDPTMAVLWNPALHTVRLATPMDDFGMFERGRRVGNTVIIHPAYAGNPSVLRHELAHLFHDPAEEPFTWSQAVLDWLLWLPREIRARWYESPALQDIAAAA